LQFRIGFVRGGGRTTDQQEKRGQANDVFFRSDTAASVSSL
jgi:hypothetical protein